MTIDDDVRPSRSLTHKISTFDDPDNFPGISLWQPYGGLIWLAGMGFRGKELETRMGRIHYRGPLIITVAKRTDPLALDYARRLLVGSGRVPAEIFEHACGVDFAGKAVAEFEVDDCRPMTMGDHSLAFTNPEVTTIEGRFVWAADKITALDPFPVRGAQGFFRVPREAVARARKFSTTRAERAKARAEYAASSKCECGAPFPRHLAEFMNNDSRCQHSCPCGHKYVVQDMKFVVAGSERNAVTEASHGA